MKVNGDSPIITWTPAKYHRLRKLYEHALKNNEDIITFEGHQLVTNYAKYLLEYLALYLKGVDQ